MKKEPLSTVVVFLLAIMCIAVACIQEPLPPSINTPVMPSNSPPSPVPSPPATPTSNPSTTLSVQELKLKIEKSDSFVLVDVRSRTDFDTSHIDGAISIPLEEIPNRYGEIQQGIEVVVYAQCAWPGDTNGTRAVQMLVEKGFPNVKELVGGFSAWQKAEYPLTSPLTQGSSPIHVVYQPDLVLNVGDTAIEVWLKDLDGNQVSLSELYTRKPVMLQFGSYTCPQFRQQVAGTELLIAKYRDQVQFVLVYVIESNPFGSKSPYSDGEWQSIYSFDAKGNPVTQPQTYEERVRLASLCVRDASITSLVLLDEIYNPIWQVYGRPANLAYLIGTDGKILEAQPWYDVGRMEQAIQRYLKGP